MYAFGRFHIPQFNGRNRKLNEAETRAELIDPALKDAGWGVVEGSRVRREVITLGRLQGVGARGEQEKADFVLSHSRLLALDNNHLRQTGTSEETAAVGSEETAEETSVVGSEETAKKILGMMRKNASISAAEIAQTIGMSSRVVERHIARLKATDQVRRIGPTKGGVWQVRQ